MEPRQLLSAGSLEIQVGGVYYEDDGGEDRGVDQIEITWTGGAPGTTLTQLTIRTDKNGDGLYSNGDVIFDTEPGGMGVFGSAELAIVDQTGIEWVGQPQVVDGGMALVIDFVGFDAGEKLVFTLDVDEWGDDLGGTLPPEQAINAVVEGGEFQGSKMEATFSAEHYAEAQGSDLFLDWYDSKLTGSGLDLPTDDYVPPGTTPHPVRTAGAIFSVTQTPLPITIAGTVFEDMDANNRQDSGDRGLSEVELELYEWQSDAYVPTGHTTTTDAKGDYKFEGVLPGTYQIVETQPDGYLSVGARAGTVDGQTRGAVETGDVIGQIELLGGEDSVDNDFAETKPSSISGRVIVDANDNCVYDLGETLLTDVTVYLLDASGERIASTLTDTLGEYSFTGLMPGMYGVEEIQPDGYFDSGDHAGSEGGKLVPSDTIKAITLVSGTTAVRYDFCEVEPASLSGFVYVDENNNGLRDAGEAPIAGVALKLLDAQGIPTGDTTTTNAKGFYRFDGLAPHQAYGVAETQPKEFFDGLDAAGTAGGAAHNPGDLITGAMLPPGVAAEEYNFGELPPASISGYVYVDQNNNGARDEGEAAIVGVELALLDGQGNPTGDTTTTDTNGFYRFDGLKPEELYGVAETQPEGYYDGLDAAGTEGGVAHNPGDLITGALLPAGVAAEEYNFGEYLPASISGRVHAELNRDCIRDPGEPLLAGVTIYLLDASGNRIDSTTTDAKGEYIFSNLEPGRYGVEEIQPPEYADGKDHVGSAGGALDGNDRVTGAKLISGTEAINYNFCEVVPASLSGYVFQDGATIKIGPFEEAPELAEVRDGTFTADDTPIAGVVLQLGDASGQPILDSGGQPRIAVTDSGGFYQFTNLEPGNYTVLEVHPDGYTDGIDTPGSEGGVAVNPHQTVEPIALERLTVDPQDDAIISIRLDPGDEAISYNFSEVVVEKLPYIPPPPPPPPPPPTPPSPTPPLYTPPAASTPGVARYVPPQIELLPMYGGEVVVDAFTWHLSVVNAGQPRRDSTGVGSQSTVYSSNFNPVSWSGTAMDRSQWVLADEWGETITRFQFGPEGGTPLAGDFNGDGVSEVAVFLGGVWFIDLNGNGVWDEADLWARMGTENDLPVVGDWDGDGKTDIGIFGPAWTGDVRAIVLEPGLPDSQNELTGRYKNVPPTVQEATIGQRAMQRTEQGNLRADLIDHVFQYGNEGDVPIAGDWNGDGVSNIGLFRAGTWYLDVDGNGRWSAADAYIEQLGGAGDLPVVGDFNGDGIDDPGVYRDGIWRLDSDGDRTLTAHDKVLELGTADDKPVVGDFNGDGIDEIAIYRDGVTQPDQQALRPTDTTTAQ